MAAVTTPRQSLVFYAVSGGLTDDHCDRQLIEIWHKISLKAHNCADVCRRKIGQFFDLNQLFHGQSD
jgi:hypothetical protein